MEVNAAELRIYAQKTTVSYINVQPMKELGEYLTTLKEEDWMFKEIPETT